jgi:hypothetical protein
MGVTRIEVDEYTCGLCDYKWLNRVNGKDGLIPKRCPNASINIGRRDISEPLSNVIDMLQLLIEDYGLSM